MEIASMSNELNKTMGPEAYASNQSAQHTGQVPGGQKNQREKASMKLLSR
jgi:hypothetical protein